MSSDITVYGACWCPDCRRSKRFLNEHQIPYEWIDIEQNESDRAHVGLLNDGKRIIPTFTFNDSIYAVEIK